MKLGEIDFRVWGISEKVFYNDCANKNSYV